MSISQLLQPNSYNLFGKSLNGITTEEITGTNVNGQVLTITNRDEKIVAFTDIPSDIPDTVGFPDGYVLKIIDNTTNTVNWEPDAGTGATVPFILTGDNVNALAIRNTALDTKLRVDTNDDQILLTAQNTIVQGADDFLKFTVYTNADGVNPVISVSTATGGTGLIVGGGEDAVQKFGVNNSTQLTMFNVNTLDGISTFNNPINVGVSARIDTASGKIKLDSTENFASKLELNNDYIGTNQYVISVEPDGSTTNITSDALVNTANSITTNANTNFITGAPEKSKFVVETSTGIQALTVNTFDDIGEVYVGASGGLNSTSKFNVLKNDGLTFLSIDTSNKKLVLNDGIKKGMTSLLNTPELLPIGIQSAVNTKLEYDEGGAGNSDYVGYIATNGPNAVYNLVNDIGTGLFLVAPSAGIQTTATNMFINSQTPLSNLNINFNRDIEIIGDNNDSSVKIGSDTGVVSLTARQSVVIQSNNSDTRFFGTVNMGINYPFVDASIIGLPTSPKQLTTKEYVDLQVGQIYSGTSFGPLVNGTGPLIGSLIPSSGVGSLTIPPNTFQAGQTYHLVIAGNANFSGNNTLTINLLGSSGSLGSLLLTTELTNGTKPFEIEVDFSLHTIGVVGTLVSNFDFTYIGTNQGTFVGGRSCAQFSINTIVSQTLSVDASFNAGTNTIQTYSMYIKRMT